MALSEIVQFSDIPHDFEDPLKWCSNNIRSLHLYFIDICISTF